MTTGEYGVVTDLYALIPFILLLLTMGMETGYFHFAGKAGTSEEKRLIFQTTWGIVILVSLLFFGFTLLFLHPLSVVMDYAGTPSYLLLMGSIITVDAVTALPFAKLREENKASAYVKIRVVTILVNLFFCIVFYSDSCRPGNPASDKTEIASAFIYLFVAFADQRGYGYRQ